MNRRQTPFLNETSITSRDSAREVLELAGRACCIHDLARARLPGLISADGGCRNTFDINAFSGAVYICLLRATGLIESPCAIEDEVALIGPMLHHVNADGGFYKFPGSPSGKAITRVVTLGLRLVLGDIAPRHRPRLWFRRNDLLTAEQEDRLRRILDRADEFLQKGPNPGLEFEFDHRIFDRLLNAYIGAGPPFPWTPFLAPRFIARLHRKGWSEQFFLRLGRLFRRLLPAISILYGGIRSDSRSPANRSISRLAEVIIGQQNENGGWFYNTVYPMLNLMALREAGLDLTAPPIQRGYSHLRSRMVATADGHKALNVMDSDVWNTSHTIFSHILSPSGTANDPVIAPAIDYLLGAQEEDGGFAWGQPFRRDPDNDSTGFALRALGMALPTADSPMKSRLERAIQRGISYLQLNQGRHGGWSVWEQTSASGRPGSMGILTQILLDRPTADVAARIVEGLAYCGVTVNAPSMRRALRFFIHLQSPKGGWWCRWWAGFLPGTDMVLLALARLGFRWGAWTPIPTDRILDQTHHALKAGIGFILSTQNGDGGWGETIQADSDESRAGIGASTPLLTAATLSTLLRTGYPAASDPILRAVAYLLSTASSDGTWSDRQCTFSIFSRTFYYSYPFLNAILPLDALTDFLLATGDEGVPLPPGMPDRVT